ncbi:sulfate permease [Microbacterium limosum]|uniref:Sulfate permease n=1 Tax=Microbacterium limosum TaxID=3079935 RepID=A0AAU0ML95_9MICO|nr:sulfate permease [Microbacterium sp. Y20]WOQ70745.1 sulfate permease [Microbacterium sp. Y20]
MFRLLWNLSIRVRLFLRTYMPTNILLDALRTRRGLKWGVPAMLIAVPYLLGAWLLTVWIADGGPGWLNLLVLLFIWNALKFLVNGPITMIVLIRARVAERRDRRLAERESTGYAISEDAPLLTSSRA